MNSSITSTSATITQISSFYGPGATACWVLILFSVLVSWTLHTKHRSHDSIDNDFIALLTFPAVAGGHLIFQMFRLPGGYRNVFAMEHVNLLPAIEASVTVCDTFANYVGPGLFAIAFYRIHLKRAGLVALVMFLTLAPQIVLYFQPGALDLIPPPTIRYIVSFGSALPSNDYGISEEIETESIALVAAQTSASHHNKPSATWIAPKDLTTDLANFAFSDTRSRKLISCSLWRPYFFDVTPVMMLIMFVRCTEILLAVWALYSLFMCRKRVRVDNSRTRHPGEHNDRLAGTAYNKDDFWMRFTAFVTMIMLPLVASTTVATSLGTFGYTIHLGSTPLIERLAFFIPKTNDTLTELDQAVAVGAGSTTLLLSLYGAWKSWKTDEE
jgi:hypothetical protein